jgi:glyoxylase-like metal-dependent hydrolase (beta-lactamase superfamily II)
MKIFAINAGNFKLDGGAMFGVVPKTMWHKANPSDENNMCSWAMRCLLIDDGERRILIDTGMGNKQDAKFFSHYHPHGDDSIASNLAKYGYTPDDITDVFLTHLHFDHCGGSIVREGDNLLPAFKNASYWSNQEHWAEATNPNEREKASFLKENILPIAESGKLHYVHTKEGEEWIPNVKLRYCIGHTEQMMLPQLDYNGRTILFCADLIPSAAHVSMPWIMAYDMRPLDTLKEKNLILGEAVEKNWVLFFEHDKVNECCTLQQTERGIRIKDTFTLDALVAGLY